MKDCSRYLNIPFKKGGRDLGGLDCYGLVRLVEKELFDLEIPDFSYGELTLSEQARLFKNGLAEVKPVPAAKPSEGSLVIAANGSHAGVYMGGDLVLHTTQAQGSVLEPLEFFGGGRFYDFR